jgi:hypothetical protein
MGFIVVAGVIFAIVIVLIALFSRTATHETYRPTAGFPFSLGAAQLHELARAILIQRSLRIESEDTNDAGGSELIATDPTPVLGGRLCVRTLPGSAPAGAAEVQSAMDQARGEGYHKVLLIAPRGFSDEARSTADESLVELVDGPRLLELSRGAVDMAALREGRVVPRPETTIRAQQMAATDAHADG